MRANRFVELLFMRNNLTKCTFLSSLLIFLCYLQADISKLGDSDCSGFKVAEDELDDECLGLVPNSSCRVPQVPSPPTSGLYWLKNSYSSLDRTAFVPDICDNHVQDAINCGNLAERRKKF